MELSNLNFSQIAELVIQKRPDQWEQHESIVNLTRRDINYHLGQKHSIKQKIKFLKNEIEKCNEQLNAPEIKYGILPFFNMESSILIDGVLGTFNRAIIQDPQKQDKIQKLQHSYKKFPEMTQKAMEGNLDINEAFDESRKLVSVAPESIEKNSSLDILNKLMQMTSEEREMFAFDQIMGINAIQNQIKWLEQKIASFQKLKETSQDEQPRINEYDLVPIQGNLDQNQIARAFDFFCEEKFHGNSLLKKSEVDCLKKIGLSKPGKDQYSGPLFTISNFKGSKSIVYSFMYEIWYAHCFTLKDTKMDYALFINSFFKNFPDAEGIYKQMKSSKSKYVNEKIRKYIPHRSQVLGD